MKSASTKLVLGVSFIAFALAAYLGWCAVGFGKKYEGTQLHNASANGDLEKVKMLVENGDDVNQLDENGDTPLVKSVISSQFDVSNYLLSKGGSLAIKNKLGITGREKIMSLDYSYLPELKRPSYWVEITYDSK